MRFVSCSGNGPETPPTNQLPTSAYSAASRGLFPHLHLPHVRSLGCRSMLFDCVQLWTAAAAKEHPANVVGGNGKDTNTTSTSTPPRNRVTGCGGTNHSAAGAPEDGRDHFLASGGGGGRCWSRGRFGVPGGSASRKGGCGGGGERDSLLLLPHDDRMIVSAHPRNSSL